jgi:hypothetical protein
MVMQLLRTAWTKWKAFGHKVATFQSRVMLFVFYFLILGPFALVMRAFSDPLELRAGTARGWLERAAPIHEVAVQARRQF